MNYDSIEFYDEKTLREWYQKFLDDDTDSLVLPSIPFGFYSIRNELVKRQNIREESE